MFLPIWLFLLENFKLNLVDDEGNEIIVGFPDRNYPYVCM